MVSESGTRCSMAALVAGRTILNFTAEKAPEAPVFSLDKPPLI